MSERDRIFLRRVGWLLALIALPIGSFAGGIAFVDVTAASGLRFTHATGAFGKKWLPETMGPGVILFDADGDRRLDVFFPNGTAFPGKAGPRTTAKLFRNLGGMRFEDASARSGLGFSAYCFGGAAGDLDNDGDADLFVTCLGRDRLYWNLGGGRFVDKSDAAGLVKVDEFGTSAALVDVDADGRLDIVVGRYVDWSPDKDVHCRLDGKAKTYCTPEAYAGASPRLYRNLGGGRFEDATTARGLSSPTSKVLGIAVTDVDDDGWPDLALANDTRPNQLFRNRDGTRFEEIGVAAGIAFGENGEARGGMGIDAADFDGSGRDGLVIGNFANERVALYRNTGDALYVDVALASELGRKTLHILTFGAFFFDADRDGWLDLFLANGHLDRAIEKVQPRVKYAQPPQLFRNLGDGRFVEVVDAALAQPRVGRGAAWGDLDDDGDPDVVLATNGGAAVLFENRSPAAQWLGLGFVGRSSNRDAIGARVEIVSGGRRQIARVRTGCSYLSQSQTAPLFGLGNATQVDRLDVRWPSGATSHLENVAAGRVVTVVEPR